MIAQLLGYTPDKSPFHFRSNTNLKNTTLNGNVDMQHMCMPLDCKRKLQYRNWEPTETQGV